MDQSLRNAGVAVSRVPTIVARIASPDRSDRLVTSLANLTLRQPRSSRRNRPYEAGQLARHGHTNLVDLHAACMQPRKALGQAQLRFPRDVADRLGQLFGSTLRSIAHARLETVVPRRLDEQSARMRIAGLGNAAARHAITAGVFR